MWLIPKSMFSVFAPASVCLMREYASHYQGQGLWVTLSGKPMLRPFSWRGWKTRSWSQLLFGAGILSPLNPTHGAVLWTESLRASHVRQSPTLAGGKASKTSVGSSPTSCDSFAKLAPDGSFLRTSGDFSQLMLDGSSERYSGSYPKAGLMRSGSLSRRPMWAPPINESGSSSWHTPKANDAEKRGDNIKDDPRNGLVTQAPKWPTPDAGVSGRSNKSLSDGATDRPCLAKRAKQWATPDATAGDRGAAGNQHKSLQRDVSQWPTPRTPTGGGESAERKKELGRTEAGGGDLQAAAQNWPTPDASAHKYRLSGGSQQSKSLEPVSRQVLVISLNGTPLSKTDLQTSERQRLNPAFVCWLMGWPWWWTRAGRISFAAEEMASWRSKLRSLLLSLVDE